MAAMESPAVYEVGRHHSGHCSHLPGRGMLPVGGLPGRLAGVRRERRQTRVFAAFNCLPMGLAAMWTEEFNPGPAAAVRALDVLLSAAKGDPLPLEPYGDLSSHNVAVPGLVRSVAKVLSLLGGIELAGPHCMSADCDLGRQQDPCPVCSPPPGRVHGLAAMGRRFRGLVLDFAGF